MIPPDKRARLKAAGFSDAEIDADFGPAITPKIGAESSGTRATLKNATPEQVAANRKANTDLAKGVARSAADGLLLGFGDNAENLLLRTPLQTIRGEQKAFAAENPKTAMVSELAGGLLLGGGAAKALTKAPALASLLTNPTAGVARRLTTATAGGALAGGVTGAGKADGVDVTGGARTGALVGGLTAGVFGAGVEGVRGAMSLLGSGVRGGVNAPAGARKSVGSWIERRLGTGDAETQGARRVLNRVPVGRTADEYATALEQADPVKAAAEVLDEMDPRKALAGTQGLRLGRNVGRERDMLDRSLGERAAEEPARWARTVGRESGVTSPTDPKRVAEQFRQKGLDESAPFYAQVDELPDVTDETIADVVDRLNSTPKYGTNALKEAQARAGSRGDQFPDVFRPEEQLTSTRTAGGALRDFEKASDDALLDEYERITTQMQKDMGEAQYRYTETNQGGGNHGVVVPTATRGAGGGPSMQAKALQRLKLQQGVLDRLDMELGKRGVDPSDALARRAMAGDGSFSGGLADALDEPPLPPSVYPVPVRNVLDLRRGLDETIRSMQEAGENPEVLANIVEMRKRIDGIAKQFEPVKQGDEIFARRMGEGESFRKGSGLNTALTPEEVTARAAEAASPEQFQRGAANRLLTDVANVADGEAGRTANPVVAAMGSETRRARARAAFPDEASYERARADAEQIVQRLLTQRRVSSNSTTAANLAEMVDEFMLDPKALAGAMTNPAGAVTSLLGSQGKRLAQGMSADQATVMGRLLGGGLPGQMTKPEVASLLRAAVPKLEQQQRRSLLTRSGAGAVAAGSVSR